MKADGYGSSYPQETLGLLGEKYPIGLYEYLFKHRPDLYKQLVDLEHKIDQTYLDPDTSINQFKVVLRGYWKLHMTVIGEFRQVEKLDLKLPKAREDMMEQRVRA